MIWKVDKEHMFTQMGIDMMVNGRMMIKMDKGLIFLPQDNKLKAFGLKIKLLTQFNDIFIYNY